MNDPTQTLTDQQRLAGYDQAVALCRRAGVAPRNINVDAGTWRNGGAVADVAIDIPSSDLDGDNPEHRSEALRRVAAMAKALSNVGIVEKSSGSYYYTLTVSKQLEVIGAGAPFELMVYLAATMNVEMVCEMKPVIDPDTGEQKVETFETTEATYHKVTKVRAVTEKICPPSLLAGLR